MTDCHIYKLIKSHCARIPSKTAVLAADSSATYAEVIALADGVARTLLDAGLQRENPVAIYMQRDAGLLGALLGVMKAGGPYVPIDLQDPSERVMTMLKLAGCKFIVGDQMNFNRLAGLGVSQHHPAPVFVDINRVNPLPNSIDASAPVDAQLAYLIFTSGST